MTTLRDLILNETARVLMYGVHVEEVTITRVVRDDSGQGYVYYRDRYGKEDLSCREDVFAMDETDRLIEQLNVVKHCADIWIQRLNENAEPVAA